MLVVVDGPEVVVFVASALFTVTPALTLGSNKKTKTAMNARRSIRRS